MYTINNTSSTCTVIYYNVLYLIATSQLIPEKQISQIECGRLLMSTKTTEYRNTVI